MVLKCCQYCIRVWDVMCSFEPHNSVYGGGVSILMRSLAAFWCFWFLFFVVVGFVFVVM